MFSHFRVDHLLQHFNCTLSTALKRRFSDSLKTVESAFYVSPAREENEWRKSNSRSPVVGRTVESYRIAMEEEIHRWDGFARALRKDDKEAFDELMDMCRSFAMASSNATNPIIFEPMIMSMLLAQQERIRTVEKKLNTIKSEASSSSAGSPEIKEENYQVKTIPQPGSVGGDQT
jgi:hypothetical protein